MNGVVGIFTSDERADEENLPEEIASPAEEAVAPSWEPASTPVEPAE